VREGRNTESGEQEAPPRTNVVRLPRDWLGPRDELVPFGPRASSEDAEEPPPTAEDFWGERSASIHDALQAPADSIDPPAGTQARRRFDRRPRAAAVGGLAVALVVLIGVVSIVLSPSGAQRPTTGSKVAVAAVFGSGVSRLLHLGLAELTASVPPNLSARAASRTVRRKTVLRAAHRAPAIRPTHRARPQLRSSPAVSIDTAHTTTTSPSTNAETSHVEAAPTYRSAPPPPPSHPVSRPAASSATASPTGESGALGPIQSPNG
jgi:hypothetical protein